MQNNNSINKQKFANYNLINAVFNPSTQLQRPQNTFFSQFQFGIKLHVELPNMNEQPPVHQPRIHIFNFFSLVI